MFNLQGHNSGIDWPRQAQAGGDRPQIELEHPRKIMIVEDDDDLRDATTSLVRMMGYEVISAANGEQALHMLQKMQELPSLILLDLWMPIMDGATLLSELEKDGQLAEVPVVVISAVADQLETQLDGHVEECLTKPVTYNELLGVVTRNSVQSKPH